jgi:acetyl esterase/lipase
VAEAHVLRIALTLAALAAALPAAAADMRFVRDVAYGADARQRFDVYGPEGAHGAPVIFMVHGGGWAIGDKANRAVVRNKTARWVPRGFVFVSANYRMLPEADPLEQARDVARALAAAQAQAASWGGDPARFILMGHSAGAHLVALIASAPKIALDLGARPWLGTVELDSAALDVERIMRGRHLRLYDRAFGTDPAYWEKASPLARLAAPGAPFLAVCSTRRADSCPAARDYAAKAQALGTRASVLEEDLSHGEINEQLGEDSDYTRAVEAFLDALTAR